MTWGAEKGRPLPPNWDTEIVPAIKQRDGGRCRWILPSGKRCPRPGTEVDHAGSPNDHRLIKLRLLCKFHHGKRTAMQGWQAKWKKRAGSGRNTEEHPNR